MIIAYCNDRENEHPTNLFTMHITWWYNIVSLSNPQGLTCVDAKVKPNYQCLFTSVSGYPFFVFSKLDQSTRHRHMVAPLNIKCFQCFCVSYS
jgi:hypothetical protein